MEHNTTKRIHVAAPTTEEVNAKILELVRYSTAHLQVLAGEQEANLAYVQAELDKAIEAYRAAQIRAAALAKLVR